MVIPAFPGQPEFRGVGYLLNTGETAGQWGLAFLTEQKNFAKYVQNYF